LNTSRTFACGTICVSGDLNFVQIGRFEIRSHFLHSTSVEISSSTILLLEPSRDAPALSRNRASDTSISKVSTTFTPPLAIWGTCSAVSRHESSGIGKDRSLGASASVRANPLLADVSIYKISREHTVGIKGYETKQEKVSHSGVSVGIFLKGRPPLLGANLFSEKRLE
jgi:hypothetical protein